MSLIWLTRASPPGRKGEQRIMLLTIAEPNHYSRVSPKSEMSYAGVLGRSWWFLGQICLMKYLTKQKFTTFLYYWSRAFNMLRHISNVPESDSIPRFATPTGTSFHRTWYDNGCFAFPSQGGCKRVRELQWEVGGCSFHAARPGHTVTQQALLTVCCRAVLRSSGNQDLKGRAQCPEKKK